ncbi:kelch-like protein 5 isoform X3 [Oncorhynchus mykiss]|uniref:kelch-like protein 5 isoform X3 n=1 Tax=Oncorhynchus mykiss TaxID=8022 RepID=UPI001878CAB9|nr:kelch-like protein 5 isoform X3 [Oncorhynchus mykiss]
MSTSGSSSSSLRKDFDVKQILRSRWRWFGHPAVPPPHNPPPGDFFTGRGAGASPGEYQSPSVSVCSTSNGTVNGTGTGNNCIVAVGTSGNGSCSGNSSCNANNRTFTDNYVGSPTDNLPVTAFAAAAAGHSSCPRSFSQPEWVTRLSVSHSRPVTDTERPADGSSLLQPAVPEASVPVAEEETGLTGTESNNNHDDTASSSCRTSNSSATLSSCVSMEPCATPDECVYTAHTHADLTFSRMETYLRTKQLCDVTLVAGDRRIPAHRLVLSSVSDYFAAMFTSDVREAKQEEVKMEGVDPDALWVLVQYAYTGRVELREDTIECILSVSCLLQLQSVVQACCNFLIKQLHPSNCLGIRSYADTQSCTHLHHTAHSYTMFLADLECNPLLRDSVESQRLLMEGMKYHLLPHRRPLLQSPRTRPRKATVGAMFAVGGMDATKGATSIEQYCLRRDAWSQVAVLSGRRLQFGVCVLDRRLYVVGGRDGLKTLNTVECYDPDGGSWSVMTPMSTHRHGLGVTVLEGPMYAVGGHDGWSYLSTVERWDPQARQWSFIASMATPRSTVGVAVLSGKLYAVGGRDGSSCLRSVECFDPHTNRWSCCAPMAKRRGGVGVATWNGFLYAIGGHDAPASSLASRLSDCVERYDPQADAWTAVAPMSVSRDAVGVCLLGDRLYAVGGYDGTVYLNTVEAYDPQTNEWTQVAPLCLGRAGACVVAVKL